MTLRALAGLTGLNLLVLAVGAAVLYGLHGWRSWTDLIRLAGLAYLLGVASVTSLLTLALVAGIPFGWPVIGLSCGALLSIGVLFGSRRRGTRRMSARWALPGLTALGAVWLAAIVVYFEALFRSARLAPLADWDTWRCWTLRAEAIFHHDGLDQAVFSSPTCPGYPPGLSVLEASAFHAMGSVDVVTLHVQFWFLAAGFVAALAGLLAPSVRQSILLPFLLLALVLPSVTERATDGKADLVLAYLTAVGAVLLLLWLEDGQAWRLPAVTILLAGALLTKREGLLLVGFVIAAALAASWRERRRAWPRLLACALGAVALSLPWRIWLAVEDLRSGAPPGGYLDLLEHADRAFPSLRLVVRTFLDFDLWLLAVPLALAAAGLALLAQARRHAVFVLVFAGVSVLGCTWAIWSEPALEITQDYGLNPVVRLVGGPVLVLLALTPLVLEQALRPALADGRESRVAAGVSRIARVGRGSALPWAVVLVAALAYPASMLAGVSSLRLPGGAPSFPSVSECVPALVDGARVRVVVGYAMTYAEADALRLRAQPVLGETEVEQDGCGRLRVYVDDVPPAAGAELLGRSVAAELSPTLEGDPDG
ncbi:MAG: hypothetical protein ACRDQT_00500 [Gaiellaceae bacterium]